MKKNILVFPCGSEIALEVYRSVQNSAHFNLFGASSVDDHGKFVFENYIGNVPFITDDGFIDAIRRIVLEHSIDAVYPAMDAVIEVLKSNESSIGCKVISSCLETTKICMSKSMTYRHLNDVVKTPRLYEDANVVNKFPVFVKPDIGYGSRGASKVNNIEELKVRLGDYPESVICEYLPGKEYTVDCFTDRSGELLVAKPRERCRVMNGISVNTRPVKDDGEFNEFALKINDAMRFRGAWFFQVKRNLDGQLVLLEVASRFGGSSSLFRAKGVNFALMSLYDAFDIPVSVLENDYDVEMDRALDNRYKIDISYDEVFVDFDDCICLERTKLNVKLIEFLYGCVNRGVRITLLSKHDDQNLGALDDLLENMRIKQLFDRIIHIGEKDEKYKCIDNNHSIFIDDSFAERRKVAEKCGIPVFSLDMIEVL